MAPMFADLKSKEIAPLLDPESQAVKQSELAKNRHHSEPLRWG
jgi:hypothetical protein